MVTTAEGEEPEVPATERAVNAVRSAGQTVRKVSGANAAVPFRILVLFAIIGISLCMGPWPIAGLGVAALALLAIDVGQTRGR